MIPEWGIETDEPSWAWTNPAPTVPPAFVPQTPLATQTPPTPAEFEWPAWHNPPPDPIDRTGLPLSLLADVRPVIALSVEPGPRGARESALPRTRARGSRGFPWGFREI